MHRCNLKLRACDGRSPCGKCRQLEPKDMSSTHNQFCMACPPPPGCGEHLVSFNGSASDLSSCGGGGARSTDMSLVDCIASTGVEIGKSIPLGRRLVVAPFPGGVN